MQRIQNPRIRSFLNRWKHKRINRRLSQTLDAMPNVQIGKNITFNAYGNIGFVNRDSRLEIGNDIYMFADMRLAVFEKGVLKIGNRCVFSGGQIACRYKITIGNYFMAGSNVIIEDSEGHPMEPEWRRKQVDWMFEKEAARIPTESDVPLAPKEKAFFDKYPFAGMPPKVGYNVSEVVIGENVWIGRGTSIRKGVVIGNNCVIATGSIVTKDIPDDHVAAGVPAKPLKEMERRNFETIMSEILEEFPDYQGDAHGSWY